MIPSRRLLAILLATAAWGLPLAGGWARPAGAAPLIRLEILQPTEGQVTGTTAEVRIMASGGGLSQTLEFSVTVDGQLVDPATGRLVPGSPGLVAVAPFTVPGSAQRRFSLRGLGVGVHVMKVVPRDIAAASGDSVAFSVGPQLRSTGPNVVGIVIALLLVGLLILYRKRVMHPRMERLQRETTTRDDDAHPGTGWGPDDWPGGLPPKWKEPGDGG